MSKRTRANNDAPTGRSSIDTLQHFIQVFRDPPNPHSVISSVVVEVAALSEDVSEGSDDEPEGGSATDGSGSDGEDMPLVWKKPYRGLQFQADGANQCNILFVAHFLKIRGKSVPNLGKTGTLFKTLAMELGKLEPLMAAVTGSILSSLFEHLVKESINLEQFMEVASGIQWQETMIQNQADELKQLNKEMEIEKANQATEKARKVQEGEAENRDIILASMQPWQQQDTSSGSLQQGMSNQSLSEEASMSFLTVATPKEVQPAKPSNKRNDTVQKQIVYQEWEEKVWDGFQLLKQETDSALLIFSGKLDTQVNQISHINQAVISMGNQLQGFTVTLKPLVQAIEGLLKEPQQMQRKLRNLEDNISLIGKK
ncbi:hypothetical protein CPB97_003956, partial [Podila verticillata]